MQSPSFAVVIALERLDKPNIKQVEEWLKNAGLGEVSSETILQRTYESTEEGLEIIKLKSTSALTLISKSPFGHELEALQ